MRVNIQKIDKFSILVGLAKLTYCKVFWLMNLSVNYDELDGKLCKNNESK